MRHRLNLLATLLIAAGLILGALYPLSSNDVTCGTAFFDRTRTRTTLEVDQLAIENGIAPTANECDAARSKWRTVWLVVAGGGAFLLVAGWIAAGSQQRRDDG